jgi:UDP-glucuronate 4-epimerase
MPLHTSNGKPTILVTGAAGFIGFHLAQRFIRDGYSVVGLDSINDYYDVTLKEARLAQLTIHPGFRFSHVDMAHQQSLHAFFNTQGPFSHIVHLAAQAGVRYSIENPVTYVRNNIEAFMYLLEECRHQKEYLSHMVYASTSSVYGAHHTPFREDMPVDTPLSLYAATKISNEVMAESYRRLYALPFTGIRMFTVYGPWGRPDMSLFKFTTALLRGESINVFNNGQMARDFTYIDDIVDGLMAALWKSPASDIMLPHHPMYNLGNSTSVPLMTLIDTLEQVIGCTAHIHFMPLQPGDVHATLSDSTKAKHDLGYTPNVSIEQGVKSFVDWYRSYYRV